MRKGIEDTFRRHRVSVRFLEIVELLEERLRLQTYAEPDALFDGYGALGARAILVWDNSQDYLEILFHERGNIEYFYLHRASFRTKESEQTVHSLFLLGPPMWVWAALKKIHKKVEN